MKMVIVSTTCTDWSDIFNMPSGFDRDFGRLILKGGKIIPQVLASAPFPKGHEQEALDFYKTFLNNLLDATFVRTLPKDRFISVAETMWGPEQDPERWLTYLHQVASCTGYEDFDETKYKPLPDDVLESLQADDHP